MEIIELKESDIDSVCIRSASTVSRARACATSVDGNRKTVRQEGEYYETWSDYRYT